MSEQYFVLSFPQTSFLMPWNFNIFGAGLGMVAELNNDLHFQASELHFPEPGGAEMVWREHANMRSRF